MNFEITQATPNDAATILAIQKNAYLSEAELHDDFELPPLKQSLDELLAEFASKTFLKATLNNQIIGSGQVRYDAGSSFIGRMSIQPIHQGKGYGSQMLNALEKVYPKTIRWELFTGEKSRSNLAMYKHRGYKPFKTAVLGKTKIIFLEKFSHYACR